MDTKQIAARWVALNEPYTSNGNHGAGEPDGALYVKRASSSLLLTAPHAVRHYRSKDLPSKKSDIWTGGLCELLGEKLDISSVTATGFKQKWHTWDERSDDFKRIVAAAADRGVFVLDLHGMQDNHNVDICIGLGPEPSERVMLFADNLRTALSPFNVAINKPFDATLPFTVTSFVQLRGGDGLQIEIAAHLRKPKSYPDESAGFVQALANALREAQ